MRDAAIRTHLANIRNHLAAMERHGRQAADRRQQILGDHTYDTGPRGHAARTDALRELAAQADQAIAGEHAKAADVLAWCADEIREGRNEWRTPGTRAQAAAERVNALLQTLKLPQVLGALVADDDQPGLEYVHRHLAALARASAGPKPNPRGLAEYIAATDERLQAVRWEDMDGTERTFHELRKGVADAQDALPRERVHWSKVARGTVTTGDKVRHAMENDPQWVAVVDGDAASPVEAANAPEPVGA